MRKFALVLFMAIMIGIPVSKAQTGTPISEQDFVDFLATVLSDSSIDDGRIKVDSLIDTQRNNQQEIDRVLDWAAKYLLDNRSPLYSPEAYDSLFVMDRVGRTVMNFNFKDTTGTVHSLYYSNSFPQADSTVRGNLVLFFYSADCDHCISQLVEWKNSPDSIPAFLQDAKVLAICLNDGDESLWRKSVTLLPHGWKPVVDQDGLIARRRYDLRKLPHTVIINKQFVSLKRQ